MPSLNRVQIIGNLGRDVEMRYTANGNAVSSFSVAVNEKWTSNGEKQERTDWFTVNAWNKLAEICSQYLQKGSCVYIEGRVTLHEWEGNDGKNHARLDIVATSMQMLDRKGDGERTYSGADRYDTANDDPDDDVPFT